MLLDTNVLAMLARKLDDARSKAVEGTELYCKGATEGRDGVHGRAFLAIDPETCEVCCVACVAKS